MWTQTLIGAAGIVITGAITPGPNNFAVMAAAARSGFSGAIPAISGVVFGSAALLLLVAMGAGALLSSSPRLLAGLSAGGCLYLLYLGWRLIASSFARHDAQRESDAQAHPSGAIGLFVFQFINPKAWMLTLTVVAATQIEGQGDGGMPSAILPLAGLFIIIPAICLSLWSWLGAVLAKLVHQQPLRRWFDRAMGMLLAASAVALLIESAGSVALRGEGA